MVFIACSTTRLSLNNGLTKMGEEKGSDYADNSCRLLHAYDWWLTFAFEGQDPVCRPEWTNMPTFVNCFNRFSKKLSADLFFARKGTYLAMFDDRPNAREYARILVSYAKKSARARWVAQWKETVTRYFRSFAGAISFANVIVAEEFGVFPGDKDFKTPSLKLACPMPWEVGMSDDFDRLMSYNRKFDSLSILTTGFEPSRRFYPPPPTAEKFALSLPTRSRKDRIPSLPAPYAGLALPKNYGEVCYHLSHMVAHRWLRTCVPRHVSKYMEWWEEDLCTFLSFEVLSSLARFDKKLNRKETNRIVLGSQEKFQESSQIRARIRSGTIA
jgi:hypothetical protein